MANYGHKVGILELMEYIVSFLRLYKALYVVHKVGILELMEYIVSFLRLYKALYVVFVSRLEKYSKRSICALL